jgi:hypothetical protein
MIDVTANFLGAKKADLDLRVVDYRPIGTRRPTDVIAGLAEEIERRFFETPLGQSHPEEIGRGGSGRGHGVV